MGTFLTLGAGWILNPSVALKDVLGEPWVLVWSIILVISGSCGLISAIYSRRDEGLSLLTERVALIGVSGFSALYLGALIAYAGFTVWVIEIMFLFLFIACVWRFIQVWIRIRWCKQIGRTTVPRWRP